MQIFQNLHKENIPLFRLNFWVITSLPKVATIRNNSVAAYLISPTQTAFMCGRNILEGVIILHETDHDLHRKKQYGVIFKIYFGKTYDKMCWSILLQMLWMKGFSPKWIVWVDSFISARSMAISDNDEVRPYFQTKRSPISDTIQYCCWYACNIY